MEIGLKHKQQTIIYICRNRLTSQSAFHLCTSSLTYTIHTFESEYFLIRRVGILRPPESPPPSTVQSTINNLLFATQSLLSHSAYFEPGNSEE